MATVLDFAAGFPPADDIRRAGHAGVVAYVSPSRPGSSFGGKPITRAVADAYRAAGVQIAAVWQFGKPNGSAPSDWTTGRDGGRRMAREALDRAFAAGMPGYCPIFFAVDEDINLDQWNRTAVEFFRGVNDVLGREWTGVYGSARVCAWAIEDNVIGGRGGKRWAWQTRSWSNGEREAAAVLFQRVIDTPSAPGPRVGGITVDVNDVLAADWGQWSIDRSPLKSPAPAPTPAAPTPPKETSVALDYGITQRIPAGTDGPRSRTDNIGIHTQEGGTGDAPGLGRYCQGAGVSYNQAVDDVDTVEMVAAGNAPWSAVAANDSAFHLVFAGSFAAWSAGRWLSSDASDGLDENAMLWRGARVVAAAAQQFNIPIKWVGAITSNPNNWPAERGICGHVAFGARGGGHTDPGVGFPREEFIRRVQSFFAPVPNLIDAEAKVAAAWIGRLIKGETKLYDGKTLLGAFAAFDNGHIYWRNGANAAYAIPHGGLFEAFAARNFEHGIGFPVLRHDRHDWGGVQSFGGGVLFVPTGGPTAGFLVHGEIGKRYAAMGWETGPLGLPTSDEQPVAGTDNITQTFAHGRLTWSPTGVIVNLALEGQPA